MGLKLLHLSDIHFIKNEKFDLDEDLRNEIERDLRLLQPKFENIDAVLVGGDVAFSASHEEYEKAFNWLNEICNITKCSQENVLTIPGNHDVERKKICAVLEETHAGFKALTKRTDIDTKLGKFLEAKESCSTLLKPFENYEAFAQRYGAIPERQSPLYWEKDFQLNKAKLRIRGINSAFVSNKNDNEHKSRLMVGSHQSNLTRTDGVIYCVLCHHPPEWLYDGDDMEKDFLSRAKLHLYGHKHQSKVLQQNQSLRLSAGAVHPERNLPEWEPRYNILDLEVVEKENKFCLRVKLWKRIWSKEKTSFVPDFDNTGNEHFVYDLELDPTEVDRQNQNEITAVATPNSKTALAITLSENMIANDEEIELIDPAAPDYLRKLKYMFFSLTYPKKIKIAVNLELIDETDKDLNEVKKTQAYFNRAESKNVLSELWDEVIKLLADDEEKPDNPFKK